jgi:MoxR-like ATPase
MKASELKSAVKTLIEIQQPGFIWGPPGGGKSAIMRQAVKELNKTWKDRRVVLMDPVDFLGVPSVMSGRTKWNTPDFLLDLGPRDVLFLDELNAAPPQTQAACYQLILDRALGDFILPDGCAVMAAGNRDTDRAVTHRMGSALSSRFVHLELDSNLEDWVTWALSAGINTEIISF